MTVKIVRISLVGVIALALFFGSAWGGSKARASISWADLHLTTPGAYGGTSIDVTHFLESGTESCYTSGLACYFSVEWYRYYDGFGWYLSGEASHQTDLDWAYEHASQQAGENGPQEHNFSWHDLHGQTNWNYDYPPCSSWVMSRVLAYDLNSNYLSYNVTNQIYYNLC